MSPAIMKPEVAGNIGGKLASATCCSGVVPAGESADASAKAG